jgi:hypothetical protein
MEAEPFNLQKDYHQRATRFLRQALEFDEQSNNNETAILLYKQGIRELEKAVKLNIDPNDKRAMELHGKMRQNLTMARERVNALQGLLRKENAVPPKAHAVPTKAQRPTPPRNVVLPPPRNVALTPPPVKK